MKTFRMDSKYQVEFELEEELWKFVWEDLSIEGVELGGGVGDGLRGYPD